MRPTSYRAHSARSSPRPSRSASSSARSPPPDPMGLFGDPRVERHLIADEGEFVVDEVRKHWAAVVGAILEALAAIPVLLLILWLPSQAYWVPLLLALCLLVHASWRIMGA